MPRTFAAVAFVALALLSPGRAVAGPPEGASGKMVFDEVADGLRQYRKEKDESKQYELLVLLAPSHDPRVAIVLGERLGCEDEITQLTAAILVVAHYGNPERAVDDFVGFARAWWEKNEADLRRLAKQLP